jgi:tetratricopeptide (TPR) repeat protein
MEPKNLRALEYKGASYYALKKYTEAITEYNKILKIEPKNLNALEYKGVNYYALTQYNEAIAVLKQAQTIEPDKINIVMNLIKSYCASGQIDQAKKFIDSNVLFVEKKDIFQSNQELKAVCKGKDIKLFEH